MSLLYSSLSFYFKLFKFWSCHKHYSQCLWLKAAWQTSKLQHKTQGCTHSNLPRFVAEPTPQGAVDSLERSPVFWRNVVNLQSTGQVLATVWQTVTQALTSIAQSFWFLLSHSVKSWVLLSPSASPSRRLWKHSSAEHWPIFLFFNTKSTAANCHALAHRHYCMCPSSYLCVRVHMLES